MFSGWDGMWDRGEGVTSFNLFDRLKPGNHRPAAGVWVDSGRVEKSGVAWEDGLRRVLQAVGREPCLGKDMTLDIVGHTRSCTQLRSLSEKPRIPPTTGPEHRPCLACPTR